MERIYDDAKDKNVAAVIVYQKASGGALRAYKDASKTEAFTSAELKDAFIKGCLVKFEPEDDVDIELAAPISYIAPTSDPAAILVMIESEELSLVPIFAIDPEIA